MYITIDGGTTNTRVALFDPKTKKVMDRLSLGIGARDNVLNGNRSPYKDNLKEGIAKIIAQNHLQKSNITKIIASGMICSDIGLLDLPHVIAPAGISDLKAASKAIRMEEISDLPITFLPGVKNCVTDSTLAHLSEMDIMRGEETELFGLCEMLSITGNALFVLPGSHTKLIRMDSDAKISRCVTTIAGELIAGISQNTIIKSTLPNGLSKHIVPNALVQGFTLARQYGFSAAAFKIRCAGLFTDADEATLSSLFSGMALSDDIALIQKMYADGVIVIGGSNPLREIFSLLLRHALPNAKLLVADDETVTSCTSFGAYRILS